MVGYKRAREVLKGVLGIIRGAGFPESEIISSKSSLGPDLDFDELSYGTLAEDLQDRFEIQVDIEDTYKWRNVKDVVRYVLGKIEEKESVVT